MRSTKETQQVEPAWPVGEETSTAGSNKKKEKFNRRKQQQWPKGVGGLREVKGHKVLLLWGLMLEQRG